MCPNNHLFTHETLCVRLITNKLITQSSCVHTLQQNGIVEQKNNHLLATTWVFLFHNHITKQYWREATIAITYTINWLLFTSYLDRGEW